jgi:hypothetical protein
MLTSRLVLDIDLQAMPGIVHGDQQVVPRVHEQVFVQVRGKSRQGCIDRISWCLWVPIPGDEGEVDVFLASDGLASGILHGAVDRISGKAIDGDRSAPLCGTAASANKERGRYPTWRIELHLHEGGSRVFADGVWGVGVWVVEDVAVAVRCATYTPRIGIGLRITHRHAEPECRVQLKVEGLLARFRHSTRLRRWISRQSEMPLHLVA